MTEHFGIASIAFALIGNVLARPRDAGGNAIIAAMILVGVHELLAGFGIV